MAEPSISSGGSDFPERVVIMHGDRVIYDGPAEPLRSRPLRVHPVMLVGLQYMEPPADEFRYVSQRQR